MVTYVSWSAARVIVSERSRISIDNLESDEDDAKAAGGGGGGGIVVEVVTVVVSGWATAAVAERSEITVAPTNWT